MLLWGGRGFCKTVKEAQVILEGDGKDTFDQAIEKIRTHCGCHVNSTMAMYKLMHVQQGMKTFTQFASEVEELATQCQFDTVSYQISNRGPQHGGISVSPSTSTDYRYPQAGSH